MSRSIRIGLFHRLGICDERVLHFHEITLACAKSFWQTSVFKCFKSFTRNNGQDMKYFKSNIQYGINFSELSYQ